MDPAHYCSLYPYDAPSQIQQVQLTPPLSFLSYHDSIPPDASYYTPYGQSPLMPSPVNPNFRTYPQTPTPKQSVSPPLHGLTAATAALSVNAIDPSFAEETNVTVSISTAFHLGSEPRPDTIVCSSDGVLFYVYSPTLLQIFPDVFQPSAFGSLSNPSCDGTLIQLDAPSDQLNIILHALYGTSPVAHSPDFETIVAAVDRMPAYNITPQRIIHPSKPIYELLLSYAPLRPLELYALAAYHNLHSLAVSSSSHLLAYNLPAITDQTAERIGAVYLKNLLLLHSERFHALKSILLHPPHPHPPTKKCTFQDQRKLTRAWALVSANLAWDAQPDLSTSTMKSELSPLTENLTCGMCHKALQDRIKDVMVQWASVKRTI